MTIYSPMLILLKNTGLATFHPELTLRDKSELDKHSYMPQTSYTLSKQSHKLPLKIR
jgi:hypothetical protein